MALMEIPTAGGRARLHSRLTTDRRRAWCRCQLRPFDRRNAFGRHDDARRAGLGILHVVDVGVDILIVVAFDGDLRVVSPGQTGMPTRAGLDSAMVDDDDETFERHANRVAGANELRHVVGFVFVSNERAVECVGHDSGGCSIASSARARSKPNCQQPPGAETVRKPRSR